MYGYGCVGLTAGPSVDNIFLTTGFSKATAAVVATGV